ncbi:uncharacterized protein L969DRAFT_53617 [Mixia osmundae IAM 14324]|uniref:NADH dehydrogenase [ubiquinone] 1 beta subcomplex subunit 11, mitochondrial n=1 Tax=Mixia osmundae (strain CBS 9802 / IAM 14324 / JCM 22182 / KY 12970) TaxID=764103 RepID=G7DZJ0_MIXOS|nr:uncharacterized protein L969DRAFT_53617 [Mixia osmundae IAM 14324]KEI37172.1 hypothetical protein L969DRAFT_53617 [Mixia osmundae IAM 14324]GAA96000.1 hypothetical protein E5Q_02660 [Mixia osmundae IAM 14324]
MSLLTRQAGRLAPLSRCTPLQAHRSASGHHGPAFNEPSGNLFGEPHLPPGQKRERESWELMYYWMFFGGMAGIGIVKLYSQDRSIVSWARKEAAIRMEERGETPTYDSVDAKPAFKSE